MKESVLSGSALQAQQPAEQVPIYNGKMILLTVKVFVENFKNAPVRAGEFEKAWYRLVNMETS
jgi:hypothetical protein